MKGFIVVDASVWVARLVQGDVYHKASQTWFEEQLRVGRGFLAPSLLLAEVGGAISRRSGDKTLAKRTIEALQSLPSLGLVSMEDPLARRGAELAAALGLRGADAYYVAVAARLDVPLATLDKGQAEGAAKVVRIEDICS